MNDTRVVVVDGRDVKIDPENIPKHEYDQICGTLSDCVTRALADPKRRREYEAWKAEYLAQREAALCAPADGW